MERWIGEKIGIKEMNIVMGVQNKDSAKVFFKKGKERDRVQERREELKEKFGIIIDKWFTIEERKKRYKVYEKVFELREEFRNKGINMNVETDGERMKIGEARHV